MGRLKLFIPLIVFAALAAIFMGVEREVVRGEYSPTALPSARLNRPLPDFELPLLEGEGNIARRDLLGATVVLNVWATWCPTCHYEHPFLMQLAERGEVQLYGINYKDDPEEARRWLREKGDPFVGNVVDRSGRLGLDLGVTGAPETYVVDPSGIVRLRYQGALDERVWREKFVPVLEKIRTEQESRG